MIIQHGHFTDFKVTRHTGVISVFFYKLQFWFWCNVNCLIVEHGGSI